MPTGRACGSRPPPPQAKPPPPPADTVAQAQLGQAAATDAAPSASAGITAVDSTGGTMGSDSFMASESELMEVWRAVAMATGGNCIKHYEAIADEDWKRMASVLAKVARKESEQSSGGASSACQSVGGQGGRGCASGTESFSSNAAKAAKGSTESKGFGPCSSSSKTGGSKGSKSSGSFLADLNFPDDDDMQGGKKGATSGKQGATSGKQGGKKTGKRC